MKKKNNNIFDKDFYPTPDNIIYQMLQMEVTEGKVVLEPSAGKGNIVDYLKEVGGVKEVIACEKNDDLKKILVTKCRVIESDFLQLSSDKISHVNMIVMNPPFSADEKHILHAFDIAPPGCRIIALCNLETVKNSEYYRSRRQLKSLINEYGHYVNLGDCYSTAERTTEIDIALIKLDKPNENRDTEFEGFFTEEDPEEEQQIGLMKYNFIKDLVQRYIGAVRIYDEQLDAAVRMNELTSSFFKSEMSMNMTQDDKPKSRLEFKKDLQKAAWKFIFDKMNMEKYSTKGLKEDINKFVETQTHIPFTMQNIYKMLGMVIGTQESRMDKAILEVFNKLTQHYHENRYNVEGWKTNDHYLVNQKFILGYCIEISYSGKGNMSLKWNSNNNYELIDDLSKALCYITGENFDNIGTLWNFFHSKNEDGKDRLLYFNTWYDWGFFQFKGFKKGTIHARFKDERVWALFNQRVAKLKGYPLFEGGVRKEPVKKGRKKKQPPESDLNVFALLA